MNLSTFLAHAIKLEYEAEAIYRKSSEVIDPTTNPDAVAFFREMAGYANKHLQEVMNLAGATDVSATPQSGYVWSDGATPESITPRPVAGDIINLAEAMALALKAERQAAAFYANVAASSSDQEVKTLAETLAAEEREHVLALERFMGRQPY